jgi:hypothetical protein
MNAKAEFKKYIAAAMKDLFTVRGNYMSIVSDRQYLEEKAFRFVDTCVQSHFEKTTNVEGNCNIHNYSLFSRKLQTLKTT